MTDFRYGLCCISLNLKSSFKSITRKTFLNTDIKNVIEIIKLKSNLNVKTTHDVAAYCLAKNYTYRVSSNIFPLVSLKEYNDVYSFSDALTEDTILYCNKIKQLKMAGLRLSIHPDQFNVIASENENTVENTIKELKIQSKILTLFGCDYSYENPINLHMNCSKGNIQDISERFLRNFDKLPDDVKSRLVLENEDKGVWTVENLYNHIYKHTNIPITFDYLHHQCNSGNQSEKEAFEMAYSTWGKYRPLFHYSESLPNQKNKRKHAMFPVSDFVLYKDNIDVDMEFKDKDLAIETHINLRKNYAQL